MKYRFFKDVAIVSWAQALAGVSFFLYLMACARMLGPDGFGLFQSVMGMFGILIVFGSPLNAAAVHAVASATDDDKSLVQGKLVMFGGAIGLLCALLVVIGARWICGSLNAGSVKPLLCVAPLLIVSPMLTSYYGGLQGRNMYGFFATVKIIESVIVLAVGVGLVKLGFGASGAILGYVAGMTCVLAFLLSRRALCSFDHGWGMAQGDWKRLVGPLAVFAVLLFVCNFPVVVARARMSGVESGLYSALFSLRNLVFPFSLAIALPFYSRALSGEGEPRMFAKAMGLTVLLGSGFVAVGLVLPEVVIARCHGVEYEAAARHMALYGCYLFVHMLCTVVMLQRVAIKRMRLVLLGVPVVFTCLGMVILGEVTIGRIIAVQCGAWCLYLVAVIIDETARSVVVGLRGKSGMESGVE